MIGAMSTVFPLLDQLAGAGGAFWRASWQAAVLAGLVAALQLALGRRIAPRWRHAMWLLVLVRLALPVLPSSPMSVFNLASVPAAEVTEVDPADVSVATTPVQTLVGTLPAMIRQRSPAASPAAPDPRQQWPRALAAVWAAGALFLASRMAWATRRVARTVRRLDAVHDAVVLGVLRDTAGELGLRRLPMLLAGDGLFSPALVGFVRPRLLLPRELLARFEPAELRLVLLHELAHMKRRDVLVNWLASLLTVVHWPNPVVWLAAWRLRVERELATDELVLSRTASDADRRAYGRTIVKLLETFAARAAGRPVPAGAVGILEGKQQMKRRIIMIARFAKQSRVWTVTAAALVLALGVVALTDATRAGPPTPAEDKAAAVAPAPSTPAPATGAARDEVSDYRIGPKDLVHVTVYDLEGPGLQTIKSVRVSETGGVAVPHLKESVKLAGLTEVEAARAIADAYQKAKMIDQANVAVAVAELRNLPSTIGAGERVMVSVLDLAGPGVETTKTSRVDEDGNIALPAVGLIKAKGLRGVDLERAIRDAYNKAGILQQAVVAVSLPDRGESHRLSGKAGDPAAPAATDAPLPVPAKAVDPALRTALERTLPELNFDGVGLADVFDFLRDVTTTNISVDWRGLEESGIERNTPVTMKLKDVALQDALRILLQDISRSTQLDVEGNVLRITVRPDPAPPEAAPASRPSVKLERRTYNVDDLLAGNTAGEKAELIEAILQNVEPASWRKNGGEGSATVFGVNLIVTAADDVHREVAVLLEMLRKQAANLPEGATPVEKMTVEQIGIMDPQMAGHLQIREDLQTKIEEVKAKGIQPNTPQFRELVQMLAIRDRLIAERADWFRGRNKGRYLAPSENKLLRRVG